MTHEACDVLVIGSGVAGLLTALKAAALGRVVLVTKRNVTDSSTRYAQGGIASVMDPQDSYAAHVEDTLRAGAGICRRDIVEAVVRAGPRRVRELVELGAEFTRGERERLALGREGGHSAHRIVHYKDVTGQEIERALFAAVAATPHIEVREHALAVNLVGKRASADDPVEATAVHGAYLLEEDHGTIVEQPARVTVLATGGVGKAYLYTSNPDVATGDGVAMAYRAGARVANMEFVQFHPTCLYDPRGSRFLVSEAVRGEGAVLRNLAGEAFMARYDTRRELAPRDIVARAIDHEMKRRGDKFVHLDARHLGREFLQQRFPNIYAACARSGLHMDQDLIPVVPAAHYMCGGVVVDARGRTDLPYLYAVGETACTGLHGANRLASNSLLEALVFADHVVEDLRKHDFVRRPLPAIPAWSDAGTTAAYDTVVLDHDWDVVRRLLWDYVGIVRNDERLEIALRRIAVLREAIEHYYWHYRLDRDLVELRNIALCAELVARCARFRQESRGLHTTTDWPEPREAFRGDTVLGAFDPVRLWSVEQPLATRFGAWP